MKNRIVFIDLLVGKILLEGEETGTLFTPKKKKKKQNKPLIGIGEVAQQLRALSCYSSSPGFISQQPHGGSQASVMGSDSIF
jgi:hypothetical protein